MQKRKLLTAVILTIFGIATNLQAQEALPATGGEASGSGG